MLYKQKWYGKPNAEYERSMKLARKNIEGWGDKYELILDEGFQGTNEEAAIEKDIWALTIHSTVGGCVVFDCDMVPLKPYDFSREGVHAVWRGGVPSIEMMAAIGLAGTKWFSEVLVNLLARKITLKQWGAFNKGVQPDRLNIIGKPFEIPEEYYQHDRIQSIQREAKAGGK
ncbi:hypothetical protein CCP3SC15_300020 [Gammaproteobacteria bacterium]